jgi:hypothetical protein
MHYTTFPRRHNARNSRCIACRHQVSDGPKALRQLDRRRDRPWPYAGCRSGLIAQGDLFEHPPEKRTICGDEQQGGDCTGRNRCRPSGPFCKPCSRHCPHPLPEGFGQPGRGPVENARRCGAGRSASRGRSARAEVDQRFVPKACGEGRLAGLELNAAVEQHMAITFAGARDFSTISEQIGPDKDHLQDKPVTDSCSGGNCWARRSCLKLLVKRTACLFPVAWGARLRCPGVGGPVGKGGASPYLQTGVAVSRELPVPGVIGDEVQFRIGSKGDARQKTFI